jgi:hypothetical protein
MCRWHPSPPPFPKRPLPLRQLPPPKLSNHRPRLVPRVHAQLARVLAIIRSAVPHRARATTPMAPVAWPVPVLCPAHHGPPQVPWAVSQARLAPIRARCELLHALRPVLVLAVPVVPAHVRVVPVVPARALVAVPVAPVVPVAQAVPAVLVALVAQAVPAVALAVDRAVPEEVPVAVPVAVRPAAPAADAPVLVDAAVLQEHSAARVASHLVAASPSAPNVKSSTTCARRKLVAYASRVDWER